MVFPEESVTVHVTLVTPNGKVDGALLDNVGVPQLSFIVGVPKATPVAVQVEFGFNAILLGAVMIGFSTSVTVTVKLQLDVLLRLSVIVYVTVLTPFAKLYPLTSTVPVTVEASGFTTAQATDGQFPIA